MLVSLKNLIVFFILYLRHLTTLQQELNEDLAFLNHSLSVALTACLPELLKWGDGGLAQACGVLGKITAESDVLSISKMKLGLPLPLPSPECRKHA